MGKLLKKLASAVMAVVMLCLPVTVVTLAPGQAWATDLPETSILPNKWGVEEILKLVLNVLVYGLGAAATLGVIIAAILYLTARDDPQQIAKAKKRLIEVVVGLVAWAVMFAVLNWLIPGGLKLN